MRLALFLGAGASVPFGKPTTAQMKDKLRKYAPNNLLDEMLDSFLAPYKYPDIEYVLQSVRDVKKFAKSLGGEYFFEHGKNGIFSFKHGTLPFDTFISKIDEIEKSLELAIYENYRWNHDHDSTASGIYDVIFNRLQNHTNSISVFTTNYDRVIEEYCNTKHNYQCVDGFTRSPPHSELNVWNGKFDVEPNGNVIPVKLYKLHGSLNWKEHVKYGIVKTNEESLSADPNYARNLVILPTRSPKDEEDQTPFIDLIGMFESFMDKADACIVVGFSFRDLQINKIFKKFVATKKPLIVISPSSMENVCKNLLEVQIPQNFEQSKASSLAPSEGNIWCLPDGLGVSNITPTIDLAFTHITDVLEKQFKIKR